MHPEFPTSRTSHAFGLSALTAAALALSLPAAPVTAQEDMFSVPADFSEMVEARLPAVVGILSTAPVPDRKSVV